MNATQLPFLVEGILILATMGLGVLVKAKAKPYGKVRLGFHLFFFLWFATGYAFIAPAFAAHPGTPALWAPIVLMGLAIVAQLVTGVMMIAAKTLPKALPMVHGAAAAVLLLSAVAGFFLAGAGA
jgi:hypothetical protein